MDREVKYRAWDVEEDRMVAWEELIVKRDLRFLESDSDMEIMQYTGLKDRNGIEIYEGDIVEIKNKVYQIEWGYFQEGNSYTWLATGLAADYIWIHPLVNGSEHVVIGNIYENKELLKTKND